MGSVAEDCSNVDILPTVSIVMAGQEFELGTHFYVIRAKDASEKEQCTLGIQPVPMELPIWILGDPFPRKWYTV